MVATPPSGATSDWGSTVRLEDRSGRLVALPKGPAVLFFWTSWCGPCQTELRQLDRLATREIYLVHELSAEEDPQRVRAALRSQRFRHPLLLDVYGEAAERFAVEAVPTLLRIDGEGRVMERRVGLLRRPELERFCRAVHGEKTL